MFSSESIENLSKDVADSAWQDEAKTDTVSEAVDLFFEDNFHETNNSTEKAFEKLPDSKEYLAILERRLAKIKGNPDTVKQLKERREQAFQALLSSDTGLLTDSQLELDASINLTDSQTANEIIRFIKPEQPISTGEIVPIIKHDQLGKKEEEDCDSVVDK